MSMKCDLINIDVIVDIDVIVNNDLMNIKAMNIKMRYVLNAIYKYMCKHFWRIDR